MKYTIDAKGKKLGRIASEVAILLMGKNNVNFVRNKAPEVKVDIINCKEANIDSRKKNTKEYVTFTGFRGGINTEKLSHLMERKGVTEAFRRAVYRMLPNNTLRKIMMKNLTITE